MSDTDVLLLGFKNHLSLPSSRIWKASCHERRAEKPHVHPTKLVLKVTSLCILGTTGLWDVKANGVLQGY